MKEAKQIKYVACLILINSLEKNEQGRLLRRAKMRIKVAVLSRMFREVITEKSPFKQRSEEAMEQASWVSGGRLLQHEETAAAQCEAGVYLAFWENDEVAIVPGLSDRRRLRQVIGNMIVLVLNSCFLKN